MKDLLQQWLICLKHYAQMTLFFSSPSNLPLGTGCIVLSLLAYIGVGLLLLDNQYGPQEVLLLVFFEILILGSISYIFLKVKNNSGRFIQTLSALIGINLITSLATIPVMSFLVPSSEHPISSFATMINILFLVWNLAVISLIFKRSFDTGTLSAGFIALSYFMMYELLIINFI